MIARMKLIAEEPKRASASTTEGPLFQRNRYKYKSFLTVASGMMFIFLLRLVLLQAWIFRCQLRKSLVPEGEKDQRVCCLRGDVVEWQQSEVYVEVRWWSEQRGRGSLGRQNPQLRRPG